MTEMDPAAALAAVRETRSAMSTRVVTPTWYHLTLGLAMAVFFASYASHSIVVIAPAEALFFVAVFSLRSAYRHITGVWMNGYRRGRTRRAIFTMAALLVLLAGIAGGLDGGAHARWAWLVAGALAVPVVIVCGNWWDRLLHEELSDDSVAERRDAA